MNAFEAASMVEVRALAALEPYIRERAANGYMVRTDKGPLARELQEAFGDILMNLPNGNLCAIEIKAEERYTGNLFLEEWSNRNLECKQSHADRGSNPGWLFKIRSDFIFYYFVVKDELLIIPTFTLKQWAFRTPSKRDPQSLGRLWDYESKPQGKYQQRNDTWGRIVPIGDIEKDVSIKRTSVKQLTLFADVTAA